jgi:hypothetical protein
MRGILFSFVVIVFLLQSAHGAQAWRFGQQDDIHFLEDVKLRGPKGEPLYLGYMTSTQNVLAGLSIKDAGYVLGIRGASTQFYHLPEGAALERLQQSGLLPRPLPPYRLRFADYALGYSLWPLLAVVIVISLWSSARKRAEQQQINDWASTMAAAERRIAMLASQRREQSS